MADSVLFDQAFFGTGSNGYQVLKNSDLRYNPVIDKICSAVGTPDGFSEISPFLINYPHGNMIFMVRGISGAPDCYNRKTLFFHILYGDMQKINALGIDIFMLCRKGYFAERVPENCVPVSVAADDQPCRIGSAPFAWNKNALAIQCAAAQNDLLEKLLGKDVNKYAWASFSFAPLHGFDLYAISKYVSLPENIACCDEKGNMLALPEKTSTAKTSERIKSMPAPVKKSNRKFLWLFFMISAALNIFLLWQRANVQPQIVEKEVIKTVTEPAQVTVVEKIIRQEPAPVDKESLKKEIIADILKSFPEKYRIRDWNKEISADWALWLKNNTEQIDQPGYNLIQKVKYHIDFTNKFFEQQNKGEKK